MSAPDRVLLSRIDDAGINASAPRQQRWIDGWLVRFSPGKAKRARCIQAVSAGRMSVDEKLEVCQQLYVEHSLPLIVRVTPFSQPPGIDDRLESLGFEREEETCVMVLSQLPDGARSSWPTGYRVEALSHRALADVVGEFRGSPWDQREAHAERLEFSPVPFQAAAVIAPNGAVAACGQCAVEDGLVGLYDVFTAEAERRSGLAGGLCRYLLQAAKAQGAHTAYLQVERRNMAARRVYERLGFEEAYRYHYGLAPEGPRAAERIASGDAASPQRA